MADLNKIAKWWAIAQQLEEVKADEIKLRKEIFGEVFTAPTEGSKDNKWPLAEGYILQGDYKINRTVDEAVVATLRQQGDNVATLVDSVIKWKPEIKLKEWKALSSEDRKLLADLVIEKEGTPALKVVKPAR